MTYYIDLSWIGNLWNYCASAWWFPFVIAIMFGKFYIYLKEFDERPSIFVLDVEKGKYKKIGRFSREDTVGNKYRITFSTDTGVKEFFSDYSFSLLNKTPSRFFLLQKTLTFVCLKKINVKDGLKILDKRPIKNFRYYISIVPFYLLKFLMFPETAIKLWNKLDFESYRIKELDTLDILESLTRAELKLKIKYEQFRIDSEGMFNWIEDKKEICGSELMLMKNDDTHFRNIKIEDMDEIKARKIAPHEVMLDIKSKLDVQADHLVEKLILQKELDEKDRRYTEIVSQLHKVKQIERDKRDTLIKDLNEQDILNDNTLIGMLKKLKVLGYFTDDNEELVTKLLAEHLDNENKEIKKLREEKGELKGQVTQLSKITKSVVNGYKASKETQLVRKED